MLEEEISLWRKNFGVALDVWSNKMSPEFSINKIFSSWVTIFLPVPNPSCHQLGHANKIIRSSYPPCRQLRSVGSSKRVFLNPPTVFIQPKISSTLFRIRLLIL